jgi:formylglycine-generating enzyme required for sulfatase activity
MPQPSELVRALAQAREHTDHLFGLLRPEAIYERPIAERHRMIFYLGHLEAFDWNLLGRYALDSKPFHPEFDRLFAFGIDPPPGKLPCDAVADWPSRAEVERYNQRTRDEIDEFVSDVPHQLLHVAVEHRLMHAETFAYILHNLRHDLKAAPALPAAPAAPAPRAGMVEIPAGQARLGQSREEGFGWDNEFEAHAVDVPAFAISRYKVTNREYLEFVETGADAPFYWREVAGRWMYRGMFADLPLALDAPVFVTWKQASEYARWRGRALPSEQQFHRAACGASASRNMDFRYWDPIPVTADDNGDSRHPAQIVGNGWEWTSTAFGPLPGFEPFPFYRNYSEPFFDGQHYVLKGAGPRTAACFLRPSFRNWFRLEYPYVHATFRLVDC